MPGGIGRSDPLRIIAIALLVLAGCTDTGTARQERPERIFLFVVDTLRQDYVSAYGPPTRTPRIDALAAGGQRVDLALAAYHQTTMSMGALFTGHTPALETGDRAREIAWTGRSWCGMGRFSGPDDKTCVPGGLTTLAERLREAGYWTAGVTANRLLFDPAGYSQGFDRWEEVGIILRLGGTHAVQNHAEYVETRVLEALANRPRDRFFLYVHWIDVHDYRIRYGAAVRDFDTDFGRLLDALEAQGLLDDSWIILTSDHGESLGEKSPLGKRRLHKGNPSFDTELRVPLIASPAIFPEDVPIRTQDVSEVLLAALGLDPLTEPRELERDEHFVSERTYQTYRRGRFKSMRARDSMTFLLFDLEADPNETVDVAAEHPDIVSAHAARMDALTQQLRSNVELPPQLSAEDVTRLEALGYAE